MNYTVDTLPGARRFDRGQTPNMLPMAVLEGGLELLREIGLEAVGSQNRALAERFVRQLPGRDFEVVTPRERDVSGCIVSIRPRGGDVARIAEFLWASGFDFSMREGKLRFSFHLYNSEEQVDSLVDTLVSFK